MYLIERYVYPRQDRPTFCQLMILRACFNDYINGKTWVSRVLSAAFLKIKVMQKIFLKTDRKFIKTVIFSFHTFDDFLR